MTVNLKHASQVRHLVGTGANAVVVSLPDIYGEIGPIVGVTKLTGDPPDGASGGTVTYLMRDGQVIRLKISYKVGTKRKTSNILCSVEKIKTAVHSLASTTFNGGNVIKAYFPQKRRLG